ncbi:DNA polymerase III subunit gamma/tau [Albimonas sp. CAU 1670]|uniref:DNA polymerase III subunit gamma/tau n=1 Tax=Albimonas sp. CAU 1670 TaxID=3032599 RepID=UPI0023DC9E11|nr:DNA polymerase III subunit gamma/tau [Albimonas sp. CAU 1670]MDF2233002.1 DNA polymerase III subunit gamma/tau [Albimonas sp. CAU 1670]
MADDAAPPPMSLPSAEGAAYQVLARKHRPQTFADLIGQEAMVRTLRNAFETDRIAHAFVLTGVRGVGKTTTARIVAKGLNCIGPDGQGGPTVAPCGVCEPCRAIAESRHVDVLEMDAASRTGVGDVREIIESVRYRAASARYKVYIIDEVHMLSTSAFNALLKTLEEPPEHVKFIFATTEIRKVPVTVLSRCQRFDLRRIEPEVMIAHLAKICRMEGAKVAEDALALIARAAEGSVRDALSLLDQAIAHGAGETSAEEVRAMLGLADRGRVLDLFETVMKGDCAGALAELSEQYAAGADPLAVLRDLAEVTHWISIAKVTPEAAEDPTAGPEAQARARDFAARLGLRPLARAWQMLLKAMEEAAGAPNPMMAAEMAIIRLTHVADLPSPEDLVRRLTEQGGAPAGPGAPAPAGPGGGGPSAGPAMGAPSGGQGGEMRAAANGGAATPAHAPATAAAPRAQSAPRPTLAAASPDVARREAPPLPEAVAALTTFEAVLELVRDKRDARLLVELEAHVRLVSYQPGRIVFEPAHDAPESLASDLAQRLMAWTGSRWMVAVESGGGAPTVREREAAERDDLHARLKEHPLVAAAIAAFPGAEILATRAFGASEEPEETQTAPEWEETPEDEDWDGWEPVDAFDGD